MREILFRGRTLDGFAWAEGCLVHRTEYYGESCNEYFIVAEGDFDYDEYDSVQVDPETVGQYTGLTDKNGVKIFEGDVVLCDRYINDVFDKKKYLVRECDFRFGLVGESLSGNEISGDEWEFAEVIGNIYDNPEMLKEGGEE